MFQNHRNDMYLRIALVLVVLATISCEKDIHREIQTGFFTDSRDSSLYSTVTLGSQTWMSENLAYLPRIDSINEYSAVNAHYYLLKYSRDTTVEANEQDYFEEFGVLYNWIGALSSCPEGWRLPSDEDWKILELYLGMKAQDVDEYGWRTSGNVDIKLKTTYGWYMNDNGTNVSGFNVRPGSYTNAPDDFESPGIGAFFWSSTINLETGKVWFRGIRSLNNGLARITADRSRGMSVRCIKTD